jgi:POT family proton-dependent oligopeptide transporter
MQGTTPAAPAVGGTFLRQPRGLATLFFTEMWERFTYYGMRSVLILFLVSAASQGGLGFDDQTASSIYGLYICGTYVFAPVGGWIADRLLGPQKAVIGGGLFIIAGNALLVVGNREVFFAGLLVIVLGVGLLKPNISAMVAGLYPEGGSRRDAGFSIFYMGISVGAVLGSFLVPLCAAHYGWRAGFALPAIGMVFGLGYFLVTRGRLIAAVEVPARLSFASGASSTGDVPARSLSRVGASPPRARPSAWFPVIVILVPVIAIAALAMSGTLHLDPNTLAGDASWLLALVAAGYFLYLLIFAGLTAEERKRLYVMMALFAAYAIFYAGFEQGGASMNLFAERYTQRTLSGWSFPAGILQGATALYTIVFAPVFAALWLALGRRGRDLSPPAKFATGLVLLGLGAVVMVVASRLVVAGYKVSAFWLLGTYLLQECGDLCLSPVGLSSMTKLAPARYVSQVMGVWFLALALGNNLAGQLSRQYDASNLSSLPSLFLEIAGLSLAAAAVMYALAPRLEHLMRGAN